MRDPFGVGGAGCGGVSVVYPHNPVVLVGV